MHAVGSSIKHTINIEIKDMVVGTNSHLLRIGLRNIGYSRHSGLLSMGSNRHLAVSGCNRRRPMRDDRCVLVLVPCTFLAVYTIQTTRPVSTVPYHRLSVAVGGSSRRHQSGPSKSTRRQSILDLPPPHRDTTRILHSKSIPIPTPW